MTDNVRYLSDGRDQRGRFTSGPNNKGRPLGAKAKASRELLAQVKALGPDAVQKLWEALTKGERWAVELILSHSLPRERTVEFEGATTEDVTAALKAGDISAAEAKDIAATLKTLAEVGELAEIKERLAELEAALAERQR